MLLGNMGGCGSSGDSVAEMIRRAQPELPSEARWWREERHPTVAPSFLLKTLFERQSAYQRVVIAQHDVVGRLLILDGILQVTEADSTVSEEMMAHVPLIGAEHPARRVLVIGGGDGCVAREVLKHPSVQRVTMVELDEVVVEACRAWMPNITCDYDDPRMELVIDDAAQYVKQAPSGCFDAVLCDSPHSIGPAEVLFSHEFYADVQRLLTPHGAAVFQSGVPFFQADRTATVVAQLRTLFPQVTVYQAAVPTFYGGSTALVLASNSLRGFDRPREPFVCSFYNPDVHAAAFALPTWWRRDILGHIA